MFSIQFRNLITNRNGKFGNLSVVAQAVLLQGMVVCLPNVSFAADGETSESESAAEVAAPATDAPATDSSAVSDDSPWYIPSFLSDWSLGSDEVDHPVGSASLEVIEPYIDLHTAPGRGYPIFDSVEQGARIEILKRRTNWYKVRTSEGVEGWATANSIGKTLLPTGIPADLPEVGHGEYLASRWRMGFTVGNFEQADSFSVTLGYRPIQWVGVEVELGRVFDQSVTGEYQNLNLIIEPFPKWDITPYVLVGTSTVSFEARKKVVFDDLGDADGTALGFGASYYIGRNFLVRGEMRTYTLEGELGESDFTEWKIGLSSFF